MGAFEFSDKFCQNNTMYLLALESVNQDKNIFTEAVFNKGKETIQPVIELIEKVRNYASEYMDGVADSKAEAAFKTFTKIEEFKKLEDAFVKAFGFRSVVIYPYSMGYSKKNGGYDHGDINAFTYTEQRYVIEGLVTDKGFYDSSHSLSFEMYIHVNAFLKLEASEILAVIIHEIGHNLDPALVDIKYTETNILSKYLMDRKGKLNKSEERHMELSKKEHKMAAEVIELIILSTYIGIIALIMLLPKIITGISKALFKKTKLYDKLSKVVNNRKDKFDKVENAEAFADNIARMYGLGKELISALNKITVTTLERFKSEKERQWAIGQITKYTINDEHGTIYDRAYSLIKEYQKDLDDPMIPKKVKVQIKEDMDSLKDFLNYTKDNSDEFENNIKKIILDAIDKEGLMDDVIDKDAADKKEEQPVTESVSHSGEDWLTESKYGKKKMYRSLLPEERTEAKKKFGSHWACSIMHDRDGYFCTTHRCRSKSHPTIDGITQKEFDFVSSTS